jgi:polyphosphate kinase
MDLESRKMYVEFSKAKDEMFAYTDTKISPWYVVDADDKKKARLNCIHHLLSIVPYQDLTPEPIELHERKDSKGYVRPPIDEMTYVPQMY